MVTNWEVPTHRDLLETGGLGLLVQVRDGDQEEWREGLLCAMLDPAHYKEIYVAYVEGCDWVFWDQCRFAREQDWQ